MPGDKKLETVEELLQLYRDPARLAGYKYSQPVVSTKGINNEKFHTNLPYEEIKKIVSSCGSALLSKVPLEDRAGLGWEHVGSTSIEGMPGAMMPDALLLLPSFPSSAVVLQALLDSGYYFSCASPLDRRDVWWFLVFTEGLLEDHKLCLHVCTPDCPAAKILLECRKEQWAFDDYKEAKVNAAKGSWMEYKRDKGANSKLLTLLREKHAKKE